MWAKKTSFISRVIQEFWSAAAFSWHPREAYLAGRKKTTKKK